jgi:cytoskeleton protein RodZ
MDIGTTLRTARERHGLSIDQLARRTKISPALLKAIEDNAFERLPRGIVGRGFLRAYAAEVGRDPEEIVSEFLEQTARHVPAARGRTPEEPVRQSAPGVEAPRPGRALAGYVLVAAALLLGLVVFTRSQLTDSTPSPAAGAGAEALGSSDPGGIEPTSGDVPPGADAVAAHNIQPVSADGAPIRIEIAPQGPCWVEVRADGRLLVYRLMHAGERESFEVRQEVSIRAGEPAVFSFTINGQPGRPLGRAGVPGEVRLTLDTYEQFLAVR